MRLISKRTIIMVDMVRRWNVAVWQVQEAKTKLSELIEEANTRGPQIITRHGAERAVVLSMREYRALTAQRRDLKSYLLGGPKVDSLEIERETDTGRNVEL